MRRGSLHGYTFKQGEPILLMVFGPIALSFDSLPLYPSRASQADDDDDDDGDDDDDDSNKDEYDGDDDNGDDMTTMMTMVMTTMMVMTPTERRSQFCFHSWWASVPLIKFKKNIRRHFEDSLKNLASF